nr:hypothetical protein [Endozoicomonas sp.]
MERKKQKPVRTYPKRLPLDAKTSVLQRIIRLFRVRRGFSKQRLSEVSGVFSRTIALWEKDCEMSPRILHVAAVLDALDLELWVIDRTDGKLVDRIY